MLTKADLHGYQQKAIAHAYLQGRAGLFLSPGLGKTISSLTLIQEQLERDGTPWLVVCPLRVISVWQDEIQSWKHTRHLRISVMHGGNAKTAAESEARRLSAFNVAADIYMINYEGLPWLFQLLKPSKGAIAPFHHIIFDESQRVKDPKTARWKRYLKPMLPVFDRRVLLTGTPCGGGGLEGLWSQHFILDGGEALGTTFAEYRDEYFYPVDYNEYIWDLKEHAEQAIWGLVSPRCLSMRAEDHLDLPPLTRNTIPITLPQKLRKKYRKLEKDFFLELDQHNAILPANSATAQGKLRQFVQGGVYDDDHLWHGLHTLKVDALMALVDELQGTPLLVLYQFTAELEEIYRRLGKVPTINGKTTTSQSALTVDRWNRNQIPVLLAHPQTVALGLNMQRGNAHNICWLAPTWSLEQHIQTEHRLHRQGQERTVIVHHVVAQDTVDIAVMRALQRKDYTQRALLHALREYKTRS